jgi:biopolymer transport protein ExbD
VAIQIGSQEIAATINVTPLIDVLLVLLIVFMLLPTHSRGLESDLPQDEASASARPNPQNVVVHIGRDGSLEIDSKPVPRGELEARLQSLFAGRPDGVLFVDAANNLDFADVAGVIDTVRGAGVVRIGLLTELQKVNSASAFQPDRETFPGRYDRMKKG